MDPIILPYHEDAYRVTMRQKLVLIIAATLTGLIYALYLLNQRGYEPWIQAFSIAMCVAIVAVIIVVMVPRLVRQVTPTSLVIDQHSIATMKEDRTLVRIERSSVRKIVQTEKLIDVRGKSSSRRIKIYKGMMGDEEMERVRRELAGWG